MDLTGTVVELRKFYKKKFGVELIFGT